MHLLNWFVCGALYIICRKSIQKLTADEFNHKYFIGQRTHTHIHTHSHICIVWHRRAHTWKQWSSIKTSIKLIKCIKAKHKLQCRTKNAATTSWHLCATTHTHTHTLAVSLSHANTRTDTRMWSAVKQIIYCLTCQQHFPWEFAAQQAPLLPLSLPAARSAGISF